MRRCQRLPVMLRTPFDAERLDRLYIKTRAGTGRGNSLGNSFEEACGGGNVLWTLRPAGDSVLYPSATLDRPSSTGPMIVANCAAMMRARAMTSA